MNTFPKNLKNTLNDEQISGGLKKEFEQNGISLSPDAQIRAKSINQSWEITSGKATYNIQFGQSGLNVSLGQGNNN